MAKVRSAFGRIPSPKALEIIEAPPTPIDIPKAAIKNDTGSTTLIAAIALEPIHCPTKIVSISMFNDITRIPMDAGTACWINNLGMGLLPSASVDLKLIQQLL